MKNPQLELQQLAKETDNVKKSAQFQEYLDTMSKFWQYSYYNQLLIHQAMPTASRVAGFKTWQELGRRIRKGSKSIRILAPSKKKDEEEIYFFPVNVFDVSQTEGKELPEMDSVIDGDDKSSLLEALLVFCSARDIKVKFENLGVNGLYGYSKGGLIVVSSEESVNMQVNTLIHEIAHELLHRDKKLSKQQKEIQAESVAYVVCKHFGLETRSCNYLALYGASSEEIMKHLQVVEDTAREVIGFISSFLFFFVSVIPALATHF